jgi:hypothetical protein
MVLHNISDHVAHGFCAQFVTHAAAAAVTTASSAAASAARSLADFGFWRFGDGSGVGVSSLTLRLRGAIARCMHWFWGDGCGCAVKPCLKNECETAREKSCRC